MPIHGTRRTVALRPATRLLLGAFLLLVSVALVHPPSAFAWLESDATWTGDSMDCPACHSEAFPFATRSGPHMGYSPTSTKCAICHTVHDAPTGGIKLLPKATVRDNCMVCHDGTAGNGVYGAIAARGLSVGASH